jgi:hypothetical protein
MRRLVPIRWALVAGFLMVVPFCQTAAAQIFPGAYGVGGWGAYPVASAPLGAYSFSQQRTESQQIGAARSLAASTMTRGAMLSDAESRTQAARGQQQSNRDWWFQTQQQQMEQARAAATRGSPGPMATFEPSAYTAARPASAPATDSVIRWPAVLSEQPFAAARALVEAPYRRNPVTNPTTADYENMLKGVSDMKAVLKKVTAEISAQEYLDAESFLDKLAGEVKGRLEPPATTPKEKPAAD